MKTADPAINTVIDNIGIMVASEGGSLELLELTDDYMKVKYNAGTNEECPECVPMTDAVYQFMRASLDIHAPTDRHTGSGGLTIVEGWKTISSKKVAI